VATITRQRTGHLDDVEGVALMGQQDDGSASGTTPERADAVLRDCVQALVGLAYRTPGFDIKVSDGGRRSVRLRHVSGGLAAQLLMDGVDGTRGESIDLSPSPASFVAELTAVLAGSHSH
jgi:hypothetical protein